MKIRHFFDVVSMVIEWVIKDFPERGEINKKQLYELEYSCRVIEEYFNKFGINEFSAEYNWENEEILLYINSGPYTFEGGGESILGVLENAKSISIKCGDEGDIQTCIHIGIL